MEKLDNIKISGCDCSSVCERRGKFLELKTLHCLNTIRDWLCTVSAGSARTLMKNLACNPK